MIDTYRAGQSTLQECRDLISKLEDENAELANEKLALTEELHIVKQERDKAWRELGK